jgi:hypothetical protein
LRMSWNRASRMITISSGTTLAAASQEYLRVKTRS